MTVPIFEKLHNYTHSGVAGAHNPAKKEFYQANYAYRFNEAFSPAAKPMPLVNMDFPEIGVPLGFGFDARSISTQSGTFTSWPELMLGSPLAPSDDDALPTLGRRRIGSGWSVRFQENVLMTPTSEEGAKGLTCAQKTFMYLARASEGVIPALMLPGINGWTAFSAWIGVVCGNNGMVVGPTEAEEVWEGYAIIPDGEEHLYTVMVDVSSPAAVVFRDGVNLGWYCGTGPLNGNSVPQYCDGRALPSFGLRNSPMIGAIFEDSDDFMDLACFYVFDALLTETQRTIMEDYIRETWGLT